MAQDPPSFYLSLYAPTSASWLHAVASWLVADWSVEPFAGGVFTSVKDLRDATRRFVKPCSNRLPKYCPINIPSWVN